MRTNASCIEVVVIPGKEGTFVPGTFTGGYANDDWNPGPRGLAIDAAGDLWLGSFGLRKYHKVDGATGAILNGGGCLIGQPHALRRGDRPQRHPLVVRRRQDHVLRLDPLTETYQVIALGHYSYGLGFG